MHFHTSVVVSFLAHFAVLGMHSAYWGVNRWSRCCRESSSWSRRQQGDQGLGGSYIHPNTWNVAQCDPFACNAAEKWFLTIVLLWRGGKTVFAFVLFIFKYAISCVQHGDTLLIIASEGGHPAVVRLLLQAGADLEAEGGMVSRA